jgi:hypothetical protein
MVDYVFPLTQNVTTLAQQFGYLNSLTDVGFGGILGIIILVLLTGMLFLMLKSFSIGKAAGVSFFVGGIFAVLLWAMNLINNTVLTISVIFAVLGLILLIKESSKYEN